MNHAGTPILRSLAVAAAVTMLFWGRFLLPGRTLSPEAQMHTLAGDCRVAGADLACVTGLGPIQSADSAAPSWQEIPASYYFRMSREAGWGHPSWSPYIGSGYPIALDGHHAITSVSRWFLSHVVGDNGRDIVIVGRFFLWTLGISLALALLDVGWVAVIAGAVAAATAQYATARVDHVMLDVDLLAPWFSVLLLAYLGRRVSLRTAAALAFALGALVSSLGFPESQVVFCVVVAVLAFAALPATRGRSLLLGVATAAGFALLVPTWISLLRNLSEFVTARDAACFASTGLGVSEAWTQLMDARLGRSVVFAGTMAGAFVMTFAPPQFRSGMMALAVLFVWLIVGLPDAACRLPLVAGIRFSRHLQPHVQALLLIGAVAGADALTRRLRGSTRWLVAAVPGAAVAIVILRSSGLLTRLFLFGATTTNVVEHSALGASLALAAACLAGWVTTRQYRNGERADRPVARLLSSAAVLIVGVAIVFNARTVLANLPGSGSAPPLPRQLSPSSALGAAQALSVKEDRRHYSPAGYVYPNWGQAIGLMEMLSVEALYPRPSHELNSGLFHNWPVDGPVPDRFTPLVTSELSMTRDFQRVLAVNRVSLFTFAIDHAAFAEDGSPYERSRCRLLVRSPPQRAESWVCPAVSGVGFFPSTVSVAASRPLALSRMAELSPAVLADTAILGPEIDLRIGDETADHAEVGEGAVLAVDRRGDDLAYSLVVHRPGVFVIADTYFPGWSASVNGRPAGISRANVAFKAVRVPAGRVDLRLHFSIR